MSSRSEPWYVHAVLYVVIIALTYLLIRVAIIEPNEIVEQERYYKSESRLRMMNIREAEILWYEKHGNYTDNLDSLVYFIRNDSLVRAKVAGFDSITQRSTNPFKDLTSGEFSPDSLFITPKSFTSYLLQVDTTVSSDTVIDRRGRIVKVDTTITIGTRYLLECPDGYGTIGDLFSDALRNTASWE
jgi:hypothetical protein